MMSYQLHSWWSKAPRNKYPVVMATNRRRVDDVNERLDVEA